MPSKKPKLRGHKPTRLSTHDLGDFSRSTIEAISRQIVHRLAIGHTNIAGDDFSRIFAKAIHAEHREKPLGLADVVWENCGWSAKTLQHKTPHAAKTIRLISGRNSPSYSCGIENPHENVQKTGSAVLKIWNARIDESLKEHDELRVVIFVRNMSTLDFVIFEEELVRFQPNDYRWSKNQRDNLVAQHISEGKRCFTWQPHGSQFTIHKDISPSAVKFSIAKRPRILEEQHVINLTGFSSDWVRIVGL